MIARFILTAAHALFWAAKDARDIRGGKNINHPVRWSIRAAVEVGATLVYAHDINVATIPTTIAAAFLFSGVFRFLLNTMRGRHWNYISPSSWYDWQFLRWFMLPIDREECVEAWHVYMASRSALKAGRFVYLFEAVVVVICLMGTR